MEDSKRPMLLNPYQDVEEVYSSSYPSNGQVLVNRVSGNNHMSTQNHPKKVITLIN